VKILGLRTGAAFTSLTPEKINFGNIKDLHYNTLKENFRELLLIIANINILKRIDKDEY
jgi:hypothetical protein